MSAAFVINALRVKDEQMAILRRPETEVIKLFSCSAQLSLKFSLLINMKMPAVVGIFILIS